jgi:hypothetical protein
MNDFAARDFSEIAKALKVLQGEVQGVNVIREPKFWIVPENQKPREFSNKKLVSEWGKVYRIKPAKRISYYDWCMENLKGDWSCSHGHEVYYFRDPDDASLFKLLHS